MNVTVKMWPAWAYVVITAALVIGCSEDPTDIDDDEPADLIPPATVTDLHVVSPTPASLTLQWTAPGDNGTEGFAQSYDLRGAQEAITQENFADAVRIDMEKPPLPPGVTEDVLIDPLEQGQTYYFALKTYDDAGNVSGLSNCAHGTCPMEQVITIPDANLEQLLRESLQVPSGDLHLSDMLRLVDLAGNDKGIVELTGLGLTDLTIISGKTALRFVTATSNRISDITTLATLPELEGVYLIFNQLTDMTALVDNADFAAGDHLDVRNNSLSPGALDEQIPILVARGVTVVY